MAEKMHHPYVELAKKALETFVLTVKSYQLQILCLNFLAEELAVLSHSWKMGNLEAVLVPLSLFMITLH